jgi:hypothetical protein
LNTFEGAGDGLDVGLVEEGPAEDVVLDAAGGELHVADGAPQRRGTILKKANKKLKYF